MCVYIFYIKREGREMGVRSVVVKMVYETGRLEIILKLRSWPFTRYSPRENMKY